jgi:DNA ligase (NAD+)
VAHRLGSLDALRRASVEELGEIDQIGGVIAESVVRFFANATNQQVLDRLVEKGVGLVEPDAGTVVEGGPLEGRIVVVTGAVEGYTREGAEAAVAAAGGKATGSGSKKPFCVVAGAAPGASKITKAESLGIPVVDASDFAQLLATGELPGG